MLRHTFALGMCIVFFYACLGQDQKVARHETGNTSVARSGDSELQAKLNGNTIRVVISTNVVDLGGPTSAQPPTGDAKTNCTYSRFPCSQVNNLKIWIAGKRIIVPRSVFADCTDIGNMSITGKNGLYVLQLVGGDASEGYSVNVFFTARRVTKREVYASEANALLESTTYSPPIGLN